REEDREEEGKRGQRLLAARQQRQALRRLARRGDLDLDAHVVLGVAALLRLGDLLEPLLVARRLLRLGAAEHGARAGVLADEAETTAAAGAGSPSASGRPAGSGSRPSFVASSESTAPTSEARSRACCARTSARVTASAPPWSRVCAAFSAAAPVRRSAARRSPAARSA